MSPSCSQYKGIVVEITLDFLHHLWLIKCLVFVDVRLQNEGRHPSDQDLVSGADYADLPFMGDIADLLLNELQKDTARDTRRRLHL